MIGEGQPLDVVERSRQPVPVVFFMRHGVHERGLSGIVFATAGDDL
ncbi:MAG: hypothetical protein M3460_02590 [Actinomycetota bacterium]|nr:hypothetical protein [Actinomycetota bacterium]